MKVDENLQQLCPTIFKQSRTNDHLLFFYLIYNEKSIRKYSILIHHYLLFLIKILQKTSSLIILISLMLFILFHIQDIVHKKKEFEEIEVRTVKEN